MAGALPQSGVALIAQNAGAFVSQMAGAQRALGTFGAGAGAMSNIVTGAFRQVGAIITNIIAGAARAVASWVADSVGVAGDFEETINILGATSGATASQLADVSKKAKELGADLDLPTTSANDAAKVMLELSKAGLDVQESMDAAKGALLLAAAADTDAATATGILTGALNAFGLPATDATRIADLLAAGANASSASMTDLGAGLQQAGAIAHTAGMPVEDLITSLAALTNVGYTGSDAGTALKNALIRLIDPTDKAAKLMADLGFSAYDANGVMKPMPQLIDDLNASLAGMTPQQRNAALSNIFLSDGMKAMLPLLDLGSDGFLKLKGAVTEEGAASDVARARMQGWNGAVATTQSQLETLQLVIGTVIKNALTPLLFWVAEVIAKITAFADAMFSSSDPANFLIAAIDSVLPGFANMMAAIGNVVQALGGALPEGTNVATSVLQAVRDMLVNVVIPAITMAATWLAANLPAAIATAKAAFADVQAFVASVMPTIQNIVTLAIQVMSTFWSQHGTDIQNIVTGAYTAIKGLIEIVLGAIQGTLAIALGLMTGDWQTQMGTIRSSNETIWNGINTFLTGILNAIAGLFGTTLDGLIKLWEGNFRKMGELTNTLMAMALGFVVTKVNEIKTSIDTVIGQAVAIWNGLFGDVQSTVSSVMNEAASIVQGKIDAISGAFNSIKGVISGVISKIKDLVSALSNIDVPDILTPGSPTPFELGLRGVDKAVKQVAGDIRAQLTPAMGSLPALQPPSQAGPQTTTTYGPSYTMPVYTNQSPAVLSQSLALVEALSA